MDITPVILLDPIIYKSCGFCKKHLAKRRMCSRCKKTGYCDAECQKSDWKTHKIVCTEREVPHKRIQLAITKIISDMYEKNRNLVLQRAEHHPGIIVEIEGVQDINDLLDQTKLSVNLIPFSEIPGVAKSTVNKIKDALQNSNVSDIKYVFLVIVFVGTDSIGTCGHMETINLLLNDESLAVLNPTYSLDKLFE